MADDIGWRVMRDLGQELDGFEQNISISALQLNMISVGAHICGGLLSSLSNVPNWELRESSRSAGDVANLL
mgnify:CR=1 FL=1